MTRRGRRPDPRALRLVKGATNHRPLPEHEPRPRSLTPDPPAWLSPEARAEWNELTEEMSHVPGWLTRVDKSVLTWRCYWYSIAAQTAQYLSANGFVYESLIAHGGGKRKVLETALRPRAEVKVLRDAWSHLARCDQELGLTPASRTRVQVQPASSADNERGLDVM